jgi:hypothetical protein
MNVFVIANGYFGDLRPMKSGKVEAREPPRAHIDDRNEKTVQV